MGRWDSFGWANLQPVKPEDETTFKLAGDFLYELDVEDWGCGTGWAKNYITGKYTGVDETITPAVSRHSYLVDYISDTPGLLIRHVLEHNNHWQIILNNAIASFTKRMVLVLFTPFSIDDNEPRIIGHTGSIPDISLPRDRIIKAFDELIWTSTENLITKTQYNIEHVFFLKKEIK